MSSVGSGASCLALNNKTLNSEIETIEAAREKFKESDALNNKTLNSEIETFTVSGRAGASPSDSQ